MTGQQNLPPWMNQPGGGTPPPPPPSSPYGGQPPVGPPPTLPGAPPGYYDGPMRPPSSGLLTAFGVLNLLFALGCGCVNGGFAAAWTAILEVNHANPETDQQIRDQFVAQVESAKQQQLARARTQSEREAIERATEFFRTNPDLVINAIHAAGDSPATRTGQSAATGAAASQILLLLGSILLLLRKNAGRWLSIIAFVVLGCSMVITATKFASVTHDVSVTVAEELDKSPQVQQMTGDDRAKIAAAPEQGAEIISNVGYVSIGFCLVWPVISLLVLLLSPGIRRACEPPRPDFPQAF